MKHTPEEIKNRLSNIGEAIGGIALEYIAELEKENAELKEKYLQATDEGTSFAHLRRLENQLTKAKEIIKELIRVEYADFTNGDYSNELSKVLEQAEQFLSEVEKQPFNNYHSKEEQELNLHNALTDYCDM